MTGMDFAAARGKVRSILAPARRPAEQSKSALTDDTLRDNIIRETEAHNPRFLASANRFPELSLTNEHGAVEKHVWESFPEAMRDVARAGFQYDDPTVRPVTDVRPSHRLNREVLQAYINSPHFQESRPYTRGNETEAMFTAMAAGDVLQTEAQTRLAEHIKNAEKLEQAESELDDADSMFERLRQQAKQEVQDVGEVTAATRRAIKQALKAIDAAIANVQAQAQAQNTAAMVSAAAAAGEAAAEAAAEEVQAFSNMPGLDEGSRRQLSIDTQLKLYEKWKQNPDFHKLIQHIGRWLRSFRFKRGARTKNVRVQPVGVTSGNDLSLLLPHEAARGFSDNKLIKATFMQDFAQRSLMQWDMEGKAPAGKGACIVTWDTSGSMRGERFVWASSVTLTVQMQAHREKRPFAGIAFGTGREMASWYFPKNEPVDPDKVLDMVGRFYGGGTDITLGMREALRILETEPAFSTADVVLISDGADRFQEDDRKIVHRMRELGVRIHGISIQAPGNTYLASACDYVVDVADLANNTAMDKLAENLT